MANTATVFPQTKKRTIAFFGFAGGSVLAFMLIGPQGFLASLIFVPSLLILSVATSENRPPAQQNKHAGRAFISGCLSRFLGQINYPTMAVVVEIDGYDRLEEIYGSPALDGVVSFAQTAIESHLTEHDITINLDGARFACALAPQAPHNLEVILNTCSRIQASLAQAALVTDIPVPVTASIGFATSDKFERPTGDRILQGAFAALAEARRKSPGAVRGYSKTFSQEATSDQRIAKDARRAFERGEIFAYFQPQFRLSDGALSGFEALTRWQHPERGIISPADFLPALERAGLMGHLGDRMVTQAIEALTFWDKSGLHVPHVGVNFATGELRNPRLVETVAMRLDAANLAPDRLVVEVLETVIADKSGDDIIGNLGALADLGCRIDLDDFGTGYASITNIRRFSVGRIKIDRSFVAGVDRNVEQRDMVAAIITMADRLGVATLAEGIETRGEREALKGLGCQEGQGFHFARPMPVQETVGWATAYFAKHDVPAQLSKRAG